ncbi:queuosine precursor transporter [Oceanirhabdus seepicola]|uniref:Probable queuosine precursor transporter n=1 Tax=Oceanirhabdus seepicola TaxID=2828781 RepID=A0A9J6P236_9CLOT|nr:queuosine precursor transporter [Oceanirhabdus seepicola]MCM1990834.1 queuosine precursor transporter [Oceanirhabdus seepicola]
MNNLLVFLIFAVVNFALIAAAYKFFGKRGILGYIILSVIAANLQVNKGVIFDFGLFELEATLGNVMFAGIFLATDLLNEKYGYKEAKKSVHISIFANISFIIIMYISTIFQGLDYSSNFNEALNLFFSINGGALKAVLVGNLVYLISQSLDVYVYSKLKNWNDSRKTLWIRNNGSTLISQLVDSILVTLGFALVGIFPMSIAFTVIITTLIVKYIAAILDTPFMYLMSNITPREGADD